MAYVRIWFYRVRGGEVCAGIEVPIDWFADPSCADWDLLDYHFALYPIARVEAIACA